MVHASLLVVRHVAGIGVAPVCRRTDGDVPHEIGARIVPPVPFCDTVQFGKAYVVHAQPPLQVLRPHSHDIERGRRVPNLPAKPFVLHRSPQRIEWLSVHGEVRTSADVHDFGRDLLRPVRVHVQPLHLKPRLRRTSADGAQTRRVQTHQHLTAGNVARQLVVELQRPYVVRKPPDTLRQRQNHLLAPSGLACFRDERHRHRDKLHLRQRPAIVVAQAYFPASSLDTRQSRSATNIHLDGRQVLARDRTGLEQFRLEFRPCVLAMELLRWRNRRLSATARQKAQIGHLQPSAIRIRRVEPEIRHKSATPPVVQVAHRIKRQLHNMPLAVAYERGNAP